MVKTERPTQSSKQPKINSLGPSKKFAHPALLKKRSVRHSNAKPAPKTEISSGRVSQLAYQAGVRISTSDFKLQCSKSVMQILRPIVENAVIYCQTAGRKTVFPVDVREAIRSKTDVVLSSS